jgi:DeoR/GlpR family transcriptional regulator of sugar metabolism
MSARKTERQKRLVAEISANPRILIRDLAKTLSVSRETIRRDLEDLNRSGRLHRRYGGGANFTPIGLETSLEIRAQQMVPERQRIAERSAELVNEHEVLFLCSGSTALMLAHVLHTTTKPLTIITNNLPAAGALASNASIRTILAPGQVDYDEGFLWGHDTTEYLKKFHADAAYLTVDGITPEGAMEIDPRTAWILRTMIAQSRRLVMMVDHSKFYQASLEKFCEIKDIHVMVTDRSPDGDLETVMRQAGVIIDVVT